MDHSRSLRSVEDDELEQVPGSIRPQKQESQRVLPDLLDHQRVFHAMLDVLVVHAVPAARRQDLHGENRITKLDISHKPGISSVGCLEIENEG